MPVTILINILSNYSDGRAKNRSQSVSISALLFTTNKKKSTRCCCKASPPKENFKNYLLSSPLHFPCTIRRNCIVYIKKKDERL